MSSIKHQQFLIIWETDIVAASISQYLKYLDPTSDSDSIHPESFCNIC